MPMSFILLNKPFRVLSQFTDSSDRPTLADYVADKSVYPAGRLDYDSEGLLLLTSDGQLQSAIASPAGKIAKHYWVQVEGSPESAQLESLKRGVTLKDGPARAVAAAICAEPAGLWPRVPPIRERKSIPATWLDVTIDAGRNRQVRRMCAAVGLPCLRLIRHAVGPWQLDDLLPGDTRQITSREAWKVLRAWAPFPLLRPAIRIATSMACS
jgi:23S rRNA pseudouridine2457 synthase